MRLVVPVAALVALGAIVYFLGTGRFGRRQTQAWIDRVSAYPALQGFLNRHHGKFRAATHYLEFGALFLVLYWIYDIWLGSGGVWRFDELAAAVIAVLSAFGAYLDEMHQLRSGTREFRRVDFLHSCAGIAIAAAIVAYSSFLRGQ